MADPDHHACGASGELASGSSKASEFQTSSFVRAAGFLDFGDFAGTSTRTLSRNPRAIKGFSDVFCCAYNGAPPVNEEQVRWFLMNPPADRAPSFLYAFLVSIKMRLKRGLCSSGEQLHHVLEVKW